MSLRRTLSALAVAALATLGVPRAAAAQEVRVEAGADVDVDALRTEIGRAVAPLGRAGLVVVSIDEREVRVRFTPEGGAPVERAVPAPADREERLRAAKFLVVNLVSDEASDLLRSLRPAPAPDPSPAPAPAPTPAPPAEPAKAAAPCVAPRAPLAVTFVSPLGYPLAPSDVPVGVGILYGDFGATRAVGFGGLATRVRCDATGVVVSGVAQWVAGETRGASVAGLLALQTGRVHGVVAAPVTVSTSPVSGAALGVVNVGETVTGAQIGVVNVASGKVHGAQVGLINVAEDVDAGVGLLSLSWSRGIRANAWTSTLSPIEVGVLLEGKRLTTAVSFGRLLQDIVSKGDFLLGFELGVHVIRADERGFLWDVVTGTDTSVGVGDGNALDVVRLGTRVGYRVLPRFAPYLYGGAAGVAKTTPIGAPKASPQDLDVRGEFGGGALF